jgi:hypothetical protein
MYTPDMDYNQTITWKSTIPTIVYKGLSMSQFSTPQTKIVSLNCGFTSVSTTGGSIFTRPIGADSGLDIISFTLLMVT